MNKYLFIIIQIGLREIFVIHSLLIDVELF